MDDASAADVADYLASLRASHSKASVARAHSSIRGFYRFLVEEGRRDDDPAVDLPSVSVSDLLPKALSEEETERLLGAVVGTGPAVLRDRALLEVLYGTGARVSEVVGLNLGDVADAVGDRRPAPRARARQGRQGTRRAARAAGPARAGRLALGGGAAAAWSPRSGGAAATPRRSSSTPGAGG